MNLHEHISWLPQPPAYSLDWNAVLAACPWLHPLADTPQDPVYHGEGDVLTHTRLVAEALINHADWRALAPHDRALLLVAALLHDIGKPATTQTEPDGHISARGHARVGAGLTRQLLWTTGGLGTPLSYTDREAITALVRLHGLPIWFLDREDLDRTILAASYRTRLDHLALLAEADARGRIAADQAELLARVDLFRAACEERNCLTQPYLFASDHSRVRYFRSAQQDPTYHVYDDTWGEVTILCGLPGAGKDTWVREYLPDVPVISLDALRQQRGVAPTDEQGAIVAAAKEQARHYLRAKQTFCWNATNLSRLIRDPLVDLMLGYNARVRLVALDAPLDAVLARNARRADPVPRNVILKLAGKYEPPDLTEAHQIVAVS